MMPAIPTVSSDKHGFTAHVTFFNNSIPLMRGYTLSFRKLIKNGPTGRRRLWQQWIAPFGQLRLPLSGILLSFDGIEQKDLSVDSPQVYP
jgi:hypothetical protein